ncbi:hypothetical protein [Bradyrhizobium diazoefficiens]
MLANAAAGIDQNGTSVDLHRTDHLTQAKSEFGSGRGIRYHIPYDINSIEKTMPCLSF